MAKANPEFDPNLIAHLEAAGWRAYYNRHWFRMLWLLIEMCRKQFNMPPLKAILGAYYATRAATAWVPQNHDLAKVLAYYTKFYVLAHRYCNLNFDPLEVARLEVEYNDVHRRLSSQKDKQEFVEVLTRLHSALFGLSPDQTQESALWRVEAVNMVDLLNRHSSLQPDQDWVTLEKYLRKCYQSIQAQLQAQPIASLL